MANLRGGSITKQLKSAFHKLEAFKTGRHKTDDHLTHSDGLAKVRDKLFRDIENFMEQENIGIKVNLALTPENMDKLLEGRLKNLANNSKESYIRSFSSLIQGLKETNIDVPIDRDYFDKKMDELRSQENWKTEVKKNQAVQNPKEVIAKLYEKRFETGVYANTLNQLGIRSAESIRLLTSPKSYLTKRDGSIFVENLKGKGNHIYSPIEIHPNLAYQILQIKNMPSYSTLYRDLKSVDVKAHGFRYLFAKLNLDKELKSGKGYRKALIAVSKQLNHHRADVTSGYVKRA